MFTTSYGINKIKMKPTRKTVKLETHFKFLRNLNRISD